MRIFGLALITLFFTPAALADNHPVFADADLEYGEYLSSECTGCHLVSGAQSNIPTIIGWDMESFIHVLELYKSKELENEVMQNIAFRLTEEEITSLAAYFSTIKGEEHTN